MNEQNKYNPDVYSPAVSMTAIDSDPVLNELLGRGAYKKLPHVIRGLRSILPKI